MNYVVIKTGGKQYKVSENSEIEIDKIEGDSESSIKFDKVLMIANEGAFTVGNPFIENSFVQATIIEQKKGKKIRVAKFKAKSRYRKVTGHRQMLTKVRIGKLSANQDKKLSKSV